jgi:hypothetical protein
MNYKKFLEVKKAVIDNDATVNYVADNLQIPTLLARCLVKDWKEQQEEFDQYKKALDIYAEKDLE